MSSKPSCTLEDAFPDITAQVYDLVHKSLNLKKMPTESNGVDELKKQENINNNTDLELRKCIVKAVAQRLEPHCSAMKKEVQEIKDMIGSCQKHTQHLIDDLKFIKMLILEAQERSKGSETTNQLKSPSKLYSKSPEI